MLQQFLAFSQYKQTIIHRGLGAHLLPEGGGGWRLVPSTPWVQQLTAAEVVNNQDSLLSVFHLLLPWKSCAGCRSHCSRLAAENTSSYCFGNSTKMSYFFINKTFTCWSKMLGDTLYSTPSFSASSPLPYIQKHCPCCLNSLIQFSPPPSGFAPKPMGIIPLPSIPTVSSC